MPYASVSFIYFIFSVATVYYAVPRNVRSAVLLLASAFWMANWNLSWAIGYFVLVNLNFFILRMARAARSWPYLVAAGIDVAAFFFLRSGGVAGFRFQPPYGTSFFTFMLLGLVLEKWKRQDQETYSWVEFVLFPQFFLFLMAGPVEKGKHFLQELRSQRDFSVADITDGLLVMSVGVLKFSFLWNLKGGISSFLGDRVSGGPWLILLGFLNTWIVYLELSSLADIGRGAARFFQIRSTVNFRPFLFARSPSDFWLRWNVSVGTWIRNHVTMPLLLSFGRTVPRDLILISSFLVMGIWHGLGWNFVLFGLFNGVIVVFSLWSEQRKFPAIFSRLLTFILLVGNGLIPHVFEKNFSILGAAVPGGQGAWFAVILASYVALEVAQEKLNDVDFYLRLPVKVKLGLTVGFLALFFYALDQELFADQRIIDLPVYFKM